MANFETRGFWLGIAAAASMTLAGAAGYASQPPNPIVNNGDFTTNTTGGVTALATTSNLSSTWTVATASTNPNACVVYGNAFSNCGYTTVNTSLLGTDPAPGGAPYFAAGSWTGTTAIISQSIANLIANEKYIIRFYQAAVADAVVNDAAKWTVSFGTAAAQNSTTMQITSGNAVGWASQSMIFTPIVSGTTATLSFLAAGGSNSGPPLALLDGITITRVPEPASLALLGLGAAGIMGLRRRRARLAV